MTRVVKASREVFGHRFLRLSPFQVIPDLSEYEVDSGGEGGGGRFVSSDGAVNEPSRDDLPSGDQVRGTGGKKVSEPHWSRISSMACRMDFGRRKVARATSTQGQRARRSTIQSYGC